MPAVTYHYMETIRLLGLRFTAEQHAASRFLERDGLRFCVDFGYDNAVRIARERWNAKRRARRRKRTDPRKSF